MMLRSRQTSALQFYRLGGFTELNAAIFTRDTMFATNGHEAA